MIATLYFARAAERSDINEHLPTFVQTCVELDATNVIELGVRDGVSTVGWLYGLEQTGGYLWSVDVDVKPPFDHDRWRFIRGDDIEPAVVLATPHNVDAVFIDTTHGYEQTLAELELYVPKVRAGGRVLLHDTEVEIPDGIVGDPPFPVKAAVQTFCDRERLFWTNRTNNNGLATIQVV